MDEFKSIKDKSIDDAEKHAHTFRTMTKNHNNRYFFTFIVCEFLNLIAAIFNFIITDKFLSGNFAFYGKRVIQYYYARDTLEAVMVTYIDEHSRQKLIPVRVNPMCCAFPTMVSCNVETVGLAGGKAVKNHICILAQNIVYQKIYLLLIYQLQILLEMFWL